MGISIVTSVRRQLNQTARVHLGRIWRAEEIDVVIALLSDTGILENIVLFNIVNPRSDIVDRDRIRIADIKETEARSHESQEKNEGKAQ